MYAMALISIFAAASEAWSTLPWLFEKTSCGEQDWCPGEALAMEGESYEG